MLELDCRVILMDQSCHLGGRNLGFEEIELGAVEAPDTPQDEGGAGGGLQLGAKLPCGPSRHSTG